MKILKAGDPTHKHLMKIQYGKTEEEDLWVCGCGRVEANPNINWDNIISGRQMSGNKKPRTKMNQIFFQLYRQPLE